MHPIDYCFVECRLQTILSIAVFNDNFISLNDFAGNFALIVQIKRSTIPLDL